MPVPVTMGKLPIPCVDLIAWSGPLSTRPKRFEPTLISSTFVPSFRTSMVWPKSFAVNPAAAKRCKLGTMRISGASISRPGRGRTWLPSRRGNARRTLWSASRATSKIVFRFSPEIFKLITREPPIWRPKIDDWAMIPRIPGSLNTDLRNTGTNSPARVMSTELAPTSVKLRKAKKKKLAILGGSPGLDSGPLTRDHKGLTSFSMRSAIDAVVAKLKPGGG